MEIASLSSQIEDLKVGFVPKINVTKGLKISAPILSFGISGGTDFDPDAATSLKSCIDGNKEVARACLF